MVDSDPRHLLYLPTHRDATTAIEEGIQEASWVQSTSAEAQPVLCVVEHRLDYEHSERHGKLLAQADHVVTLHLDEVRQMAFVDALVKALEGVDSEMRSRLTALLLPEGMSYGRGPNLASLVAVALGCSSTHRRDSDVRLDPARSHSFPIELELGALGKSVSDLSPLRRPAGEEPEWREQTVLVVGTGVFGDATIDRADLLSAGIEFAVGINQLGRPGVPYEEVKDEALSYLVEEPKLRYDDDFYEVDLNGRVEMSACALSADLFEQLPEMPTDILGCDYMVRDLAGQTTRPIIFHSRKVSHVYDASRRGRTDLDAYCQYAIRDVQYVQMGRIWQQHGLRMREHPEEFLDANNALDVDAYASSFEMFAVSSTGLLQEVRTGAIDVYERAARHSEDAVSNRLAAVATALSEAGEQVDRHVVNAVADFATLTRAWPALISAAKDLNGHLDKYLVGGPTA